MDATGRQALIQRAYDLLLAAYGPQGWWPADSAFEICVGAILTQSAAWTNVEKALGNLKGAGALSPLALHRMSETEIASMIRPAGYFNAKAAKLKALANLLYGRRHPGGPCFDGHLHCLLREPLETLRPLLLATHGIGPETADCIVLYAASYPSFVIDAYTRRVFTRVLGPDRPSASNDYYAWQAVFHDALPKDPNLYAEYHALIVSLGKAVCLKTAPQCALCPLRDVCTFAASHPR